MRDGGYSDFQFDISPHRMPSKDPPFGVAVRTSPFAIHELQPEVAPFQVDGQFLGQADSLNLDFRRAIVTIVRDLAKAVCRRSTSFAFTAGVS